MTISAENADRQALNYTKSTFIDMASVVREHFPQASHDAQLSAAVELAKAVSAEYRTYIFSGIIEDTPIRDALLSVAEFVINDEN